MSKKLPHFQLAEGDLLSLQELEIQETQVLELHLEKF